MEYNESGFHALFPADGSCLGSLCFVVGAAALADVPGAAQSCQSLQMDLAVVRENCKWTAVKFRRKDCVFEQIRIFSGFIFRILLC